MPAERDETRADLTHERRLARPFVRAPHRRLAQIRNPAAADPRRFERTLQLAAVDRLVKRLEARSQGLDPHGRAAFLHHFFEPDQEREARAAAILHPPAVHRERPAGLPHLVHQPPPRARHRRVIQASLQMDGGGRVCILHPPRGALRWSLAGHGYPNLSPPRECCEQFQAGQVRMTGGALPSSSPPKRSQGHRGGRTFLRGSFFLEPKASPKHLPLPPRASVAQW